jgi:phage baseplate assembly protein gpV
MERSLENVKDYEVLASNWENWFRSRTADVKAWLAAVH